MKKILGVSLVALMAVSTARADIASTAYVNAKTGDLANLTTSATSNLVAAINSINTTAGGAVVAAQGSENANKAMITNASGGVVPGTITSGMITDATITTDDLAATIVTSLGKADSAVQSVTEGATNGTIDVDGTEVPVHGLGTAAYTASTAYDAAGTAAGLVGTLPNDPSTSQPYTTVGAAIAAANTAAGNSVQSVTEGATNGTIDVDGTEVPVHGLGTAAYTASTAYDAAGTAAGLVEALDGGTISGSGVVTAISQADGQVSATLSQITNTEVASNAAIDLSKIAMPSLATINETGTVVLTAKAGTGEQEGQVVYAWEEIER